MVVYRTENPNQATVISDEIAQQWEAVAGFWVNQNNCGYQFPHLNAFDAAAEYVLFMAGMSPKQKPPFTACCPTVNVYKASRYLYSKNQYKPHSALNWVDWIFKKATLAGTVDIFFPTFNRQFTIEFYSQKRGQYIRVMEHKQDVFDLGKVNCHILVLNV